MNSVKIAILGLFMGLMPFVCNGMEPDDNDQDSQNMWIQAFDEQIPAGVRDKSILRDAVHSSDWPNDKALKLSTLFLAVTCKQYNLAKLLVRENADVDIDGTLWILAHHRRFNRDKAGMAQFLIDNGASVSDATIDGVTLPEMRNLLAKPYIHQKEQKKLLCRLRLFIQPYACDITLPVD